MKSPPPGGFARGQILQILMFSGMTECLDQNTLYMSGIISNWSKVDRPDLGLHNQDKNDDGLPDAGEMPYFTLPFAFTYKRLPLTP